MGVFDFIFGLVLLATIASLYRLHLSRGGGAGRAGGEERDRLRQEVETLRERLAVIERITVERENSLEREFERLRDR